MASPWGDQATVAVRGRAAFMVGAGGGAQLSVDGGGVVRRGWAPASVCVHGAYVRCAAAGLHACMPRAAAAPRQCDVVSTNPTRPPRRHRAPPRQLMALSSDFTFHSIDALAGMGARCKPPALGFNCHVIGPS